MALQSIYTGEIAGTESNRRYGLDLAENARRNRRLAMEEEAQRERTRQQRREEQRRRQRQAMMQDAVMQRQAQGVAAPANLIAPEGGFQDDPAKNAAVLQSFQKKGLDATNARLNPDGSAEIVDSQGVSRVIPPQDVTDIVAQTSPKAEAAKQEAADKEARRKLEQQKLAIEKKKLGQQQQRIDLEKERLKNKVAAPIGMPAPEKRRYDVFKQESDRLVRQMRYLMDERGEIIDQDKYDELSQRLQDTEKQMDIMRQKYMTPEEKAALREIDNAAKSRKLSEIINSSDPQVLIGKALEANGFDVAEATVNPDGSTNIVSRSGESGVLNPQQTSQIIEKVRKQADVERRKLLGLPPPRWHAVEQVEREAEEVLDNQEKYGKNSAQVAQAKAVIKARDKRLAEKAEKFMVSDEPIGTYDGGEKATPEKAPTQGKVRMRGPDGVEALVPANRVEYYKTKGAVLVGE